MVLSLASCACADLCALIERFLPGKVSVATPPCEANIVISFSRAMVRIKDQRALSLDLAGLHEWRYTDAGRHSRSPTLAFTYFSKKCFASVATSCAINAIHFAASRLLLCDSTFHF